MQMWHRLQHPGVQTRGGQTAAVLAMDHAGRKLHLGLRHPAEAGNTSSNARQRAENAFVKAKVTCSPSVTQGLGRKYKQKCCGWD